MERIAIDDVKPRVFGDGNDRRGLSEPLGTTDVAINHYRLAPGEGFPGGLHTHVDQEEVFVVLEGEATFETFEGKITVAAGELIRFGPGEFQSGNNESDEHIVALALGAPRDSEDVRIPVACPGCGHENLRLDFTGSKMTFACPDCGAEHVPRDCPDCGHDDLRLTLADGGSTVVVCQGCGSEFDNPPLR